MPQGSASKNLASRQYALAGLITNMLLAVLKLIAGIAGHSYALIADAIESLADIVGSGVIWGGLFISSRPASDQHPYGYGKAEPLAALAVAFLVLLAGLGIAVEAVREIITPHHTPQWWTLAILVLVVIIKETFFRIGLRRAKAQGSTALATDAFHHRADAITSTAAFIGISIALIGKWQTNSDKWAPADDWAALFAAAIIIYNAVRLMRPPLRELLDQQSDSIADAARDVASRVPGVVLVQKSFARKSGVLYWIDMHVWMDGHMSVHDSHAVAHAVKDAVRAALPSVRDVLIHIEPAAPSPPTTPAPNLPQHPSH
ncbi:MAG: cation diffusion facilitator family transporter [Phycisphaerales bacterium]|nr:cation transporter [Planctomycetota bacterium]